MNSREQRPSRSPSGGFSLLELILVMLIIAVVLAIAAPTLRGFASSRQVRDAAASLVVLTQWARMKAVSEARRYRLNIDIEEGEYWLEAQEGANFKELGVDFGQRFEFPVGITVEWEKPTQGGRGETIEFGPSGRTEPATLRLTGKAGTVLDVICESPSEPFRVEHRPEEEYAYE